MNQIERLSAPLFVSWQLTRDCDLTCVHCCTDSAPGRALSDEMTADQAMAFAADIVRTDVPYVMLCGGEPLRVRHFTDVAEYLGRAGVMLKIETNGHFLTPENCARLKEYGVKAVQVSLDGASQATFQRMRVRGDFNLCVEGLKNLHAAGVPIEINYSPTSFSAHEVGKAVDLAYEVGAHSFYTGRTMYTGNAVKTWNKLTPSDAQYDELFETLYAKTAEYEGRMRVHFHEMGLLDELRYRLDNPAALLIVLPNGLVKLINALPFVCGDLRKESLAQIWSNFQRAWQDPRVAEFVDELAENPGTTSNLHKWVYL